MARGSAVLLALALLAAGCAATNRGAEDVVVVATLPFHALATPAGLFLESFERDPGFAMGTAPIFIPLYLVGDIFFTGVSAVDAAMMPACAPFAVEPLGIYDMREFPPRLKTEAAEAAGTTTGWAVVALSPVAYIIAIFHGAGQSGNLSSGPWYPWNP